MIRVTLFRFRAAFMLATTLHAALAILSGQTFAQEASKQNRMAERTIAIEARAFSHFAIFDSERRQFGRLTFLGGLELRARDPEFGGFSSAVIDADGKGFLAISDHAHWIRGRFHEKNGILDGISDVELGPLLAPDGRRMKDTRYFDTEAVTRLGNQFFVSAERVHKILRFDARNGRPSGRGSLIPVPEGMKGLNGNQGIEALGVLPRQSSHAGAFLGIAERAPHGAASEDIPGFIIGGKAPGLLHVKRREGFDVTDLGFLPGGDLVILERRFTPFLGLAFRIRRIASGTVKPGALLDGEVLIEADMSYQIDNMEALMMHKAPDGRVILTLMSDNNFSILQRNLVLRFALDE